MDPRALRQLLRLRKSSLRTWVIQGRFWFENLLEKMEMFRQKVALEETVLS